MFGKTISDKIRDFSKAMDQTRRVPDELLDWMYEEKLFKLFVPEELGGKMLDLPSALRVFEKVSEIEGNIGWLTAIGSGGGAFVPYIQKQQADILFPDRRAVIAGSGYPQGTAIKVHGGFMVSGEWKYCSGAEYASFFTANSIKENGEVTSFIFMPDQVEILHDWGAFGLRGTGSHSIRVKEAFVPEVRTFNLLHKQNDYAGPVHSFPFIPFSQATFTAVCLGIAAHFQQEAKAIAARRLENGVVRFEDVISAIEEKETRLKKDIARFYSDIEALWADHVTGKSLTEEQEEHFSSTCKKTVDEAINRSNNVIRCLGMEAITEGSPINKIWRDLYTAGQHAFLTP